MRVRARGLLVLMLVRNLVRVARQAGHGRSRVAAPRALSQQLPSRDRYLDVSFPAQQFELEGTEFYLVAVYMQ